MKLKRSLRTSSTSFAFFLEGMMEKISVMAGLLASLSFPGIGPVDLYFELQLRVSFRFERNSLFIRCSKNCGEHHFRM
jgi:hypothetical protein